MVNEDDELLEALGVEVATSKQASNTPIEERIIAGFEDIVRFYELHRRVPEHSESNDIFERLYAVRLDRLRLVDTARNLLSSRDTHGLLRMPNEREPVFNVDDLDDEALLDKLGAAGFVDDITVLKHVRSSDEKRAAEEIANRTRCEDFDEFRSLFELVKSGIQSGERKSLPLRERKLDEIQEGTFFVIGGQIAFIAESNEAFTTKYDRQDRRLRVIYDNETESEVLQRSLQRALYRDELARVISEPDAGPLFGDTEEDDDLASGTIYVLRTRSSIQYIAEHRELIHKIGVTGGRVETRIGNAENEATYLLAAVDVVATYKLSNLNRTKIENIFHRIFAEVQLDLTVTDRFGHLVKPREWFLVPLHVIDEAVERIRDGSITDFAYSPTTASLVRIDRHKGIRRS